MKHLSDWKGRVVWHEDGEKNEDGSPKFYYLDDDTPIDHDNPLPCPFCGREFDPDDRVDPCLGRIPGIKNACCGHGAFDRYFQHESGIVTRQNDHLWWQHTTFPGLDAIVNDRRAYDIIDDWIRLYSNGDENVWFNMKPICSVPWRNSIPRLTYPYGMDNLTRVLNEIYRFIEEYFVVPAGLENYASIELLNRKDAIIANTLLQDPTIAKIYSSETSPTFLEKTKTGIVGAWIYDKQFILPKTDTMRLTTHAPIYLSRFYVKREFPQYVHDVYLVVHMSGFDPRGLDTAFNLLRDRFDPNNGWDNQFELM